MKKVYVGTSYDFTGKLIKKAADIVESLGYETASMPHQADAMIAFIGNDNTSTLEQDIESYLMGRPDARIIVLFMKRTSLSPHLRNLIDEHGTNIKVIHDNSSILTLKEWAEAFLRDRTGTVAG